MGQWELAAFDVLALAGKVAWLGVLLAEKAGEATFAGDRDEDSFGRVIAFFFLEHEWCIHGKAVKIILQ